jgi:hypothetical protein
MILLCNKKDYKFKTKKVKDRGWQMPATSAIIFA